MALWEISAQYKAAGKFSKVGLSSPSCGPVINPLGVRRIQEAPPK
jgi:hypothetical protein